MDIMSWVSEMTQCQQCTTLICGPTQHYKAVVISAINNQRCLSHSKYWHARRNWQHFCHSPPYVLWQRLQLYYQEHMFHMGLLLAISAVQNSLLEWLNSPPPGQNSCHFADVSRCIFVNEKLCILIEISLKFIPKSPIHNDPVLV